MLTVTELLNPKLILLPQLYARTADNANSRLIDAPSNLANSQVRCLTGLRTL